jgi:hypothetical protein
MTNHPELTLHLADGTEKIIKLDEENAIHRRFNFELKKMAAAKGNPTLKHFLESPIAEITI